MLAAWKAYADELKGQPRMRSTLLSFIPELGDDYKIVLKLMNTAQVADFNSKIKPGILNFIRQKLNNGKVDLLVEVSETNENLNAKALTPDDKLKEFIEKNPTIGKLKQRLNLDLE